MRKLKIFEHISLDGVIQNTNEDGNFPYADWTAPYRSPTGLGLVLEELGEIYDLLLGRRTYDMWSGYWPKAPGSPMADRINAATKFIVTHRPESLEWGPSQAISVDVMESVRRIKASSQKDLILWGSSTLTSPLLEQGLVDEVVLYVYPVLLGVGKRLFAEGTAPRALKLENAKPLPSGIIVQKFKPGEKLARL